MVKINFNKLKGTAFQKVLYFNFCRKCYNKFMQNKITKENMRGLAPAMVRVGMSIVFIWFGYQQLINASPWTVLVPSWVTSFSGLSALSFIYFNAVFEVVFGLCLLLGLFVRIVGFLLALHMLHITYLVGYNDVGVRDFGLLTATISVFLYGADSWCLDRFLATPEDGQAKKY